MLAGRDNFGRRILAKRCKLEIDDPQNMYVYTNKSDQYEGDLSIFALNKLLLSQDVIFGFFYSYDPFHLYRSDLGLSMKERRSLVSVEKKKHRPQAFLSRSSVLFGDILWKFIEKVKSTM